MIKRLAAKTTIFILLFLCFFAGKAYSATTTTKLIRVGQTISSISRASNVVTVNLSATYPNNNLKTGQSIVIFGVTDNSFNGTFSIASVVSQTAFTYNQTGSNASSASGTAGGHYTNLTSWAASRQGDLVSADTIEIAECYNDWSIGLIDALTISGWVTDATRYIKIYAPASERHNGTAQSGFKLRNTTLLSSPLTISEGGVVIEGLIIEQAIAGYDAIHINSVDNNNDEIQISKCVIYNSHSSPGSSIGISSSGTNFALIKAWNNIIYDFSGTNGTGIKCISGTPVWHLYNNTIYNCYSGINNVSGTIIAKNNLADRPNSGKGFLGLSDGSDYNASSDATAGNFGTYGRASQTFTFNLASNKDFFLSSADTGAKEYGLANPGSGLFSDDINSSLRSASWDIGATVSVSTLEAPTNCAISVPTTQGQLTVTWTDNSTDEAMFLLERSTDGSTWSALMQVLANQTTITDMELSDNTSYWYRVAAYKAGTANSAYSTATPKDTLPEVPAVICDKDINAWYTTDTFTFTNNAGGDATFGSGHLDHYHYLWDQTSTRTKAEIEAGATWNSGTLARTATNVGNWYLHLVAHNSQDVANIVTAKVDLGTYNYATTKYTVDDNGVQCPNPDYATIQAAINGLPNPLTGPVIIEVYDGSYGQVTLPAINGSSASNTVIIQAASGNNSVVVTGGSYGFDFNGANYVYVNGITVSSSLSHGIYMRGASNYITINNCKVTNPDSDNNENAAAIYINGPDYITLSNNTQIIGDYYVIYADNTSRNLVIDNNIWSTKGAAYDYYGITLVNCPAVKVTNNTLDSNLTSNDIGLDSGGIYLNGDCSNAIISGNAFPLLDSDTMADGILVWYASSPVTISDNVFSDNSGQNISQGIHFEHGGATSTVISNNSINGVSGQCLHFDHTDTSSMVINNNSFLSASEGIYYYYSGGNNSVINNNYFSVWSTTIYYHYSSNSGQVVRNNYFYGSTQAIYHLGSGGASSGSHARYFNNIFHNQGSYSVVSHSQSTSYVIQYQDYYYNTFYSAAGTIVSLQYYSPYWVFKNNIFYNYGTGNNYIYTVDSSSSVGFISNYNALIGLGAYKFEWAGASLMNFNSWKDYALQDSFSIWQDPKFVNTSLLPSDPAGLKLKDASACQGRAVTLAGYTTDYAGVTRNASTSDIGAYENLNPASTPIAGGTYTVKASGGDYTTIVAAAADLVARGISGNVVIKVDAGTYSGGVYLDGVPTANPETSSITIESASGSNDVIVNAITSAYGLHILGVSNVTVNNLTFKDSLGHGIYITASSNVIINSCKVLNPDSDGDENAAAIRIIGSPNVTISNNTQLIGDYYVIYASGAEGLVIDSNIWDTRSAPVDYYGFYFYACPAAQITNNILDTNLTTNDIGLDSGFYLNGNCSNTVISGNTFPMLDSDSMSYGIYVNSVSSPITISNNTFSDNSGQNISQGIHFEHGGATGTVISNNSINGVSTQCLHFDHTDTSSMVINNNSFLSGSEGIYYYYSGGSNSVINNNYFSIWTNGIYCHYSSNSGTVVKSNYFYGGSQAINHQGSGGASSGSHARYFNNIFYNQGSYGVVSHSNSTSYVIQYQDYYYNTFYSAAGTIVSLQYYSPYWIFKNNIFYNYGTGNNYIYTVDSSSATGFISNYNDLLGFGAYKFDWVGTGIASFITWKDYALQDSLSIWQDPKFVNTSLLPSDPAGLKLKDASACQGRAVTLAGYTTDYAGVTRNTSTSDIGAYENLNPASTPIAGGTYTVKASGGDYTTIVAAAADLVARGISGNVVIKVDAGTYSGGVYLDGVPTANPETSSITIESASGSNDVIVNAITSAYGLYVLGTANVTVNNLTFKDSLSHGVFITASSNVTVSNCKVTNPDADGDENAAAVCIIGSPNVTISSNTQLIGDYYVIYASAAEDVIIDSNTWDTRSAPVDYYGFYFYACPRAQITNNTLNSNLTANDISLDSGFYLNGNCSNTVISGNTFPMLDSDSMTRGIYVNSVSSPVTISDNVFSDNSGQSISQGIRFEGSGSSGSVISDNSINGVSNQCVYLYNTNTDGLVINNNYFLSGADGIYFDNAAGSNAIINNNYFSVWTTGIYYYRYSYNYGQVVKNNYFNGSTQAINYYYSAGASSGNHARIYNNIFYNQGSYSVVSQSASSSWTVPYQDYYYNTFYSAAGQIISLQNYSPYWIFKNNIFYNYGTGNNYIYVVDSTSATGFVSNNNVLIGLGAYRFQWLGTNLASFASWKDNSLQDSLSIWQDPKFVNTSLLPSDPAGLKLKDASACQGRAVTLAGYTTDYAEVTRNVSASDIGAYENLNPATTPIAGGTYTVKASGGDYTTIVAAAADLVARGISGNVVIKVDAGTYSGGVYLEGVPTANTTDSITIESASGSNDVIVNAITSSYGLYVLGTANVTVNNLTIKDSLSHGVFITAANSFTLNQCKVLNADSNGDENAIAVYIIGSKDVVISNNPQLIGDYYVIYAGAADNIIIDNNTWDTTSPTADYYGFYLYACPSAQITNNTLNTNITVLDISLDTGIYLNGNCSNTVISGNTFPMLDSDSMTRGIYVNSVSSPVTISDNVFSDNSGQSISQGIRFEGSGSSGSVISDNSINGVSTQCVHLYNTNTDGLVISNNSFLSGSEGIYFDNAAGSNAVISNNTFSVWTNGIYYYRYSYNYGQVVKNNYFNGGTQAINYYYSSGASSGNHARIYNNIFYNQGSYSVVSHSASSSWTVPYQDYYYNTFYSSAGQIISLQYYSPYWEFKNNIFYNYGTGSNYIYTVDSSSATGFVSNYNDLLSSGSNKFSWLGTNITSFASWKSTTSQDANSISANPLFMNTLGGARNYKLLPTSPCLNVGTAISGITTDFEDQTRDAQPDLGADELVLVIGSYAIGAPTPQVAGVGWTQTVSAMDDVYNFVVTPDSSTVITMANSGNAQFYTSNNYLNLQPDSQYTLVNGVATIYVKDTTAQNITLTATSSGGKTGTSGSIVVRPDIVNSYDISSTTPQVAGTGWPETVTGKDQFGNTVTLDSSTIITMSNNGSALFYTSNSYATATTNYTLLHGIANIYVKDTTAQTINLTATSSGGKTGTSGSILVNPAATKVYQLDAPADIPAGSKAAYTLVRKDIYNNPTTTGIETVYLYVNPVSANGKFYDAETDGNIVTNVAIPSGQSQIPFWYYNTLVGTYAITVSDNPSAPDGATGRIDAVDNIKVIHANPDYLKFSGNIANMTAGSQFTLPGLKAYDLYGNFVDGTGSAPYTGAKIINYDLSGLDNAPDGSVLDDYNATTPNTIDISANVNFINGACATLPPIILYRAQNTTLTVMDTNLPGTQAGRNVPSNQFYVAPKPIAKLFFTQQPSVASLTNLVFAEQPKVSVADMYGNSVPAPDQIRLAAYTRNETSQIYLPATNGTLSANALTVNLDASGVAVFNNMKYSYPETIYLRASAVQSAVSPVYSFPIEISIAVDDGALVAGPFSEPVEIPSDALTDDTRAAVFDFRLTDAGKDGYGLKVKQIKISRDTSADETGGWGAYFVDAKITDGTNTFIGTITDDALIFGTGTGVLFTVNNGAMRTFTLSVVMNQVLPENSDGKIFSFSINPDDDIVTDAVGSQFIADATPLVYSPKLQITAKRFVITGNSPTLLAGNEIMAEIKAMDNGVNLDLDYNGAKEIIFRGASIVTLPGPPSVNIYPTATNFSGNRINFGSPTMVSFTNGQSDTEIRIKLYKAEAANIKAASSDFAINTSGDDDLEVLVRGGVPAKLFWNVQPLPKAVANAPWKPFSISVADAYGNTSASDVDVSVVLNGGEIPVDAEDTATAQSGIATFNNFSAYAGAYPAIMTLSATAFGVTPSSASDQVTVEQSYAITLKVMDSTNGGPLTELTLKTADAATGVLIGNPIVGNSPINYYLPYGSYNLNISKEAYVETSANKIADYNADGLDGAYDNAIVWNTYMISVLESMSDYKVIADFVYDEVNDILNVTQRLERRGQQKTSDEINSLGVATIEIYDGPNLIATLTNPTADSVGNYWFSAEDVTSTIPTGFIQSLAKGKTYFAKCKIGYGGTDGSRATYAGGTTFTITITQSLKAVTDAIQTVTAGIANQTTELGRVVKDEIKASVEDILVPEITKVKSETTKILAATGTESLQTKIDSVKTSVVNEVQPHITSGILNSETAIKQGGTMTIRYRTATGLAPFLSVYSPNDLALISSQVMREIGATGIYQYDVTFLDSWGLGYFTVVCSEPTKGTVDALVISVGEYDIGTVSDNVSAVLGSTSGLSTLKKTTNAISSQFSEMDKLLAKISQDVAGKLGDAESAVNDLASAFKQLEDMSKQIKDIGGTAGMNLEKLYEVSKDKKEDILYIKNKSEELKAAMELNQKMLENVAKKPVVQTWFEFR